MDCTERWGKLGKRATWCGKNRKEDRERHRKKSYGKRLLRYFLADWGISRKKGRRGASKNGEDIYEHQDEGNQSSWGREAVPSSGTAMRKSEGQRTGAKPLLLAGEGERQKAQTLCGQKGHSKRIYKWTIARR